MSVEELIKDGFSAGMSAIENKRNRSAAEKKRKADLSLIKELDWNPMYSSETVPTYQKTKSPVARSYLESMLAGNNPSMTFSGSPNASQVKRKQQSAQNNMFGTMQDRVTEQRTADAATPWKVSTPTRKVVGEQEKSALWTAENVPYAQRGINKNLVDAFAAIGQPLPQVKGTELKGGVVSGHVDRVAELARLYGSPDAAAEAVRKYGGMYEALDALERRGG